MNETIVKFGYPDTLIGESDHWVALLRPAQITLGSIIVAAKADATAFGDLPVQAHTDLAIITARVESMLRQAVRYERINWLMLMMVDPNVHFHVLPRYQGTREEAGLSLADTAWPGPPDLKAATPLSPEQREHLTSWLREIWVTTP